MSDQYYHACPRRRCTADFDWVRQHDDGHSTVSVLDRPIIMQAVHVTFTGWHLPDAAIREAVREAIGNLAYYRLNSLFKL